MTFSVHARRGRSSLRSYKRRSSSWVHVSLSTEYKYM